MFVREILDNIELSIDSIKGHASPEHPVISNEVPRTIGRVLVNEELDRKLK